MAPQPGTPTWRRLLAQAAGRLRQAGLAQADGDARRLVERASGADGAALITALDEAATRRAVAHLDAMVARRSGGEPLQHVVGSWGFRQLDLLVDPRVLIPRPETEQVVEVALAELAGRTHPTGRPPTAVDLGTGSGAIALSLALEAPGTLVWATDVDPDCLAVARANLAGLGRPAGRVRLAQGDWFAALPGELRGELDLVVANPPYVARDEPLPDEVADWEPAGALRSGPTGLEDLAHIVVDAPSWLVPGGALVVEVAPHQAEAVAETATRAGLVDVVVHPDLAGRDRAVAGRRAGP